MAIGAGISFIGAFLMFPFPNELSGATVAHIRNTREAIARGGSRISTDEAATEGGNLMKKFMVSKLVIPISNRLQIYIPFQGIWNMIFVVALLEDALRNLILAGGATFLTKYIELAFEMDCTSANFWIGKYYYLFSISALPSRCNFSRRRDPRRHPRPHLRHLLGIRLPSRDRGQSQRIADQHLRRHLLYHDLYGSLPTQPEHGRNDQLLSYGHR